MWHQWLLGVWWRVKENKWYIFVPQRKIGLTKIKFSEFLAVYSVLSLGNWSWWKVDEIKSV